MSVVDVVEIIKTRAAAEAVGVPVDSTMGVPEDPAVEDTSMKPLLWGPMVWSGSSVVNVFEIVKTRAAAEALGVPMHLTMGVPASSAKVPEDPAVEATSMDPLLWGPLLGPPGLPVVDDVGTVAARAAAEAARPDVQPREYLSQGFFPKESLVRLLARIVSLARSLSFTREEALVREESLVRSRGGSREEAAMAAKREGGIIIFTDEEQRVPFRKR